MISLLDVIKGFVFIHSVDRMWRGGNLTASDANKLSTVIDSISMVSSYKVGSPEQLAVANEVSRTSIAGEVAETLRSFGDFDIKVVRTIKLLRGGVTPPPNDTTYGPMLEVKHRRSDTKLIARSVGIMESLQDKGLLEEGEFSKLNEIFQYATRDFDKYVIIWRGKNYIELKFRSEYLRLRDEYHNSVFMKEYLNAISISRGTTPVETSIALKCLVRKYSLSK